MTPFPFLFSLFQLDICWKYQIFAVVEGAFDPQVEVSVLQYDSFVLFIIVFAVRRSMCSVSIAKNVEKQKTKRRERTTCMPNRFDEQMKHPRPKRLCISPVKQRLRPPSKLFQRQPRPKNAVHRNGWFANCYANLLFVLFLRASSSLQFTPLQKYGPLSRWLKRPTDRLTDRDPPISAHPS